MSFPRRGEVYWVTLDPVVGSEMRKTRPCLILTSDTINQRRRTVVVVPLSTTSPKQPPVYVSLPSVNADSQAVMDQLRVVDRSRLGDFLGRVTDGEMKLVSAALISVLALDLEVFQ